MEGKKDLNKQGEFCTRKEEMEKLLSSPSSVSEGDQEMLSLLSPWVSNPSDQYRQVKSRVPMVVTRTQLSKQQRPHGLSAFSSPQLLCPLR